MRRCVVIFAPGRKKICLFRMGIIVLLFCMLPARRTEGSYLTVRGSDLCNDKGEVVRLTGVNWFGFETTNMFPHGLWARDYHGVLKQVRQMGFNCIRIPFSNEMLHADSQVDKPNFYGEDPYALRPKTEFNRELAGLTPLQMLDEIIAYAKVQGLVVILDNHSREHDGYMNEKLWYTGAFSEQVWIDDWVMLAERYRGNSTVIGFDLNNEPHGKGDAGGATWGAGDPVSDWNTAAEKCGNAVLAVNPDVLILIEGVEQYESTVYWWGGNLRGVHKHPISLSRPDKLVYSPHEYGPEVHQQPWFFEDAFPDNMEAIWDDAFGFLVREKTAPLLIGEFGISSEESYEGRAGKWFDRFISYMDATGISFTFWALNPNSGDTGGILSTDWVTPVQWKLDAIKPLFAPLINEPMKTREPRRNSATKTRAHIMVRDRVVTIEGVTNRNLTVSVVTLHGKTVQLETGRMFSLAPVVPGIYSIVLRSGGRTVLVRRIAVD